MTVTPQSTGVAATLPQDLVIRSIPQADVADTLQGLTPTQMLQITGNATPYTVNKSALDVLLGMSGVQDASSLHHHDSIYMRTSAGAGASLPS